MAAYTTDVDQPKTILKLLQKITFKNNIANKSIYNKVKFILKRLMYTTNNEKNSFNNIKNYCLLNRNGEKML